MLTGSPVACATADGGKNPIWNQTFAFPNVSPDNILKLEVR